MLKRILTAIVALCIFVPAMFLHNTWVFPAFFSLCALIGTFELLRCVGIHKNLWISIPLHLLAAAGPVLARVTLWHSSSAACFLWMMLSLLLVIVLYTLAVAVFGHRKLDITSAATAAFMSVYVIGGFTGMVYLNDDHSIGICLLVFIGAWITDTFAYFTGYLLGKHKLIPEVSPKKTVEGAIGGVVFCVAAFVGYAFIYPHIWGGYSLHPLAMGIIGVFVSLVSQVGDLALSQVKRHYGIKDYGNILPGHGGVLDRFDSTLAVALLLTLVFSTPL